MVSITRNGQDVSEREAHRTSTRSREQIAQRFKNAKSVYVRRTGEVIFDPIAQVISELRESGEFSRQIVTKPTRVRADDGQ